MPGKLLYLPSRMSSNINDITLCEKLMLSLLQICKGGRLMFLVKYQEVSTPECVLTLYVTSRSSCLCKPILTNGNLSEEILE